MFEPVVYWSGKRGRGRFYMESSGMEHAVLLLNVRKAELCARWAALVLSDQFIRGDGKHQPAGHLSMAAEMPLHLPSAGVIG